MAFKQLSFFFQSFPSFNCQLYLHFEYLSFSKRMQSLVSGINFRLLSVNHALTCAIRTHVFLYEWHFLRRFHRLTTFTIHHPVTPSFQAQNLHFLQILPSVAFVFVFKTNSTDSPDCLPILLSISVFYYLVFSFFSFRFRSVD